MSEHEDIKEIKREVGSIMRTVNEMFTVVCRIERKEDKILDMLAQIVPQKAQSATLKIVKH